MKNESLTKSDQRWYTSWQYWKWIAIVFGLIGELCLVAYLSRTIVIQLYVTPHYTAPSAAEKTFSMS